MITNQFVRKGTTNKVLWGALMKPKAMKATTGTSSPLSSLRLASILPVASPSKAYQVGWKNQANPQIISYCNKLSPGRRKLEAAKSILIDINRY